MKHLSVPVYIVFIGLFIAGCGSFPDSTGPTQSAQPQAAQDFVRLVNEHRVSIGLRPLEWDSDVAAAALFHSEDMRSRNYFSHIDPEGNEPWDRLNDQGVLYNAAAENIARGQRSGEQVLQTWLNSSGHRANIENGDYTHHGVGYVEEGNYWTHKFVRLR